METGVGKIFRKKRKLKTMDPELKKKIDDFLYCGIRYKINEAQENSSTIDEFNQAMESIVEDYNGAALYFDTMNRMPYDDVIEALNNFDNKEKVDFITQWVDRLLSLDGYTIKKKKD